MSTTYTLSLDRDGSGPARAVSDSALAIPSPAVVAVRRSGDPATYRLTVELVGDAWPVVTALTVELPGAPITAAQLRDMRFGQLQRAAVSFLQRSAAADVWPDSETLKLLEREDLEDLSGYIEKESARRWDEGWRSYLPPMVIDGRPDSEWALSTDPEWLAKLKLEGPKSERAWRVTAAIYRQAVEGGRPGNAAVERFLELPRSTASEWIRRARERGYLEQSPRKRRTGRESDA